MEHLTKNGVKFGECGIISTSGHHKSWYVTESRKCMGLLKRYRSAAVSK